jgi:hypothetical protein
MEEAIVCALEVQGHAVQRREDADVRAVLCIAGPAPRTT